MRILFLTDNFPPEVNAPASRTYEHARVWVERGAEVTVITCAPNFPQGKVYPGYKNKWRHTEMVDGIKVIRVWTYITANEGFLKRTLDYISFSVSSFFAGLFRKTDIIVATSPQFFTALSGRLLSFWKRTPWVMEVRDLWPESIRALGALQNERAYRLFEWQELRCYKTASKIVVVTDAFKDNLRGRGVDPAKIFVVKNGVDMSKFRPQPKDGELMSTLGLEGKKVVGYIGTHGMAHKLDFILSCADRLREDDSIHFLLIGAGAEKGNLLRMKDELALGNVTMLDPVAKEQVGRYISIIDIALINLSRSDLFKTVIPSKIFENAAMEKPILMGVEGEAQAIVENYSAGICFAPEDAEDFVNKLYTLLTDASLYGQCQDGCRKLAADFDRNKLALQLLEILS